MLDIVFTVPGFKKLPNNLNPAKASGPDLVPARINHSKADIDEDCSYFVHHLRVVVQHCMAKFL